MSEKTGNDRTWITNPAIFGLWISAFTLLLSIALSELQNKVGWLVLIATLAFVLGIFAVLLRLVIHPVQQEMKGFLDDVQAKINPNAVTWLIDTANLAKFESMSKAPEIWLLTSDLLDDSLGGPFEPVVEKKLAKGTKYVFFVPNTAEAKARCQSLITRHENHPNVKAIFLTDTFFFLVPKLDIVIYNPFSVHGFPRQGFMGIPVPDEGLHYHVAVSADFVDKIVGTLLPLYRGEAMTKVQGAPTS